jgi:hypothetical protein
VRPAELLVDFGHKAQRFYVGCVLDCDEGVVLRVVGHLVDELLELLELGEQLAVDFFEGLGLFCLLVILVVDSVELELEFF